MSGENDGQADLILTLPRNAPEFRDLALHGLYGGWSGVSIFFGSLVFFGLYWRIGVFITDTYTVANALVSVADGHLYIDQFVFGPSNGPFAAMKIHDNRLYGRNYGLIYLAVPILWLLEGLAGVVDLRILLIGGWSLLILGCFSSIGKAIDRPETMGLLGIFVSFVAFVLNITVATQLDLKLLPIIALQGVTMVATAFVGVLIYRLLSDIVGDRVGVAAAAGVVLATPVSFWAVYPKRHALSAFFLTAILYTFYRSRVASTQSLQTRYRALSYTLVGGMTLIFSAEALLAFLSLVFADFFTLTNRQGYRTHAKVAVVFLLSLIPFFLTNVTISGNPFLPVQLLPKAYHRYSISPEGIATALTSAEHTDGVSNGGTGTSGSTSQKADTVTGIYAAVKNVISNAGERLSHAVTGISSPTRLYHVFVRGGYSRAVTLRDGSQAIRLALFEASPLLVCLIGIPLSVSHRSHRELQGRISLRNLSAVRATDLLAALLMGSFLILYTPLLPVHASVTVRYLVPIIPLMVYAIARLQTIQTTLEEWNVLLWAYSVTFLIGGQFLIAALVLGVYPLGEVFQIHALLHLALGALLLVWIVTAVLSSRDFARYGAVILGVTAAMTTVFLLLSGIEYFAYSGDFALPISRFASSLIDIAG